MEPEATAGHSLAALMERKQQHHAVAIPLPAQGHMNSLMRFCRKLSAHGSFIITFVDIDPIHHRIKELHVQQQEQYATADDQPKNQPDIRRAHIPIEGVDLSNNFRFSIADFMEAMKSLAPSIEELLLSLHPPATCLISDFFMTTSTHGLALKFKLPRIMFYPFTQSLLLLTNYMVEGVVSEDETLKVLKDKNRGIFKEGLFGLPHKVNIEDLFSVQHVDDDTAYMYDHTRKELEKSIKGEEGSWCHSIVVNSFQEAECAAFEALQAQLKVPIYPIGPLIEPLQNESATSLWEDDEGCIVWLHGQPVLSVLYISFGSVAFFSQSQFEEFVSGLLASQQRFLLVFRPDLVEGTPYTTFPSTFLSASKGKGYATNWAPQLRILAHSSVGGFLTHCGLNSVMEAIGHGVPMLCWPYFADQFMNAKYVVEEWKVGLRFEKDDESRCQIITRTEVEMVVRNFMEGLEGREVRKNAKSLKELGLTSLLPGGTSFKNMETLIKSL